MEKKDMLSIIGIAFMVIFFVSATVTAAYGVKSIKAKGNNDINLMKRYHSDMGIWFVVMIASYAVGILFYFVSKNI